MTKASDDGRVFRACALAAAAFTFVVIVASAFVRQSQVDLRCMEWPACAMRPAVAAAPAPATALGGARTVHRVSATLAALFIAGMLVTGRGTHRRVAAGALALVVALAGFGAATGGSPSPLVALGNLVGGYMLLAMLVAAYAGAAPASAARAGVTVVAATALLLVLVQAAQVALADGSASAAPWLHRAVAAGCATLVIATAWGMRRQRIVAACLVGAIALLAVTHFASPSVATAVLHNASAALLVALLSAVIARGRHDG
ncbi:MAG: hypothetical protein U1F48_17005 [Burkholderiales bacterium]